MIEDEGRLQDAIAGNPQLIVPYQNDDDSESDFTILVKKCLKPRIKANKIQNIAPVESGKTLAGTKRTSKKMLKKVSSSSFGVKVDKPVVAAPEKRSPLQSSDLVLPPIVEEECYAQTANTATSTLAESRATQMPPAFLQLPTKQPKRTKCNIASSTSSQTPQETSTKTIIKASITLKDAAAKAL